MEPDIDTWEVVVLDDLDPLALNLVSEFFNENFPGVFSGNCKPEIFQWKLGDSNPAGRGFLTVAMANGRVIGTTSATAKKITDGDKIVVALEIGDTFTHPDWRKKGICITSSQHLPHQDEYFRKSVFGRLVLETIYRANLNGYSFIYGTPNSNSYPPYMKRLQFQEINQNTIFNQLNIGKSYGNSKSLLNLYGKMQYISKNITNRLTKNSIKITELTEEDIKLFLKKDSSPEKSGMVMKSDLEWIKHRYMSHPINKYRFFKVDIGQVIEGVVVATALIRPSGYRTLLISEFWSEQKNFSGYVKKILLLLQKDYSKVQVLSFWSISNKKPSLFSRNIKLIALNLKKEEVQESLFREFHLGWSDNG